MLTALVISWVAWCALHSLLIARGVEEGVRKRYPGFMAWYRFSYNVFSFLSFSILLIVTNIFRDDVVMFGWSGPGQVVRFGMLCSALFLFLGGARNYDMSSFLGFQQIRTGRESQSIGEDDHISTQGILGITRHPWYLGTFLFLWSFRGQFSTVDMVVSLVLSIYLLVGAWLEERKLLASNREEYSVYKRQVSMFLPWKWFLKRLKGIGRQ